MDTVLGIPPGESYSGIRALVDLSVCIKYSNKKLQVHYDHCLYWLSADDHSVLEICVHILYIWRYLVSS